MVYDSHQFEQHPFIEFASKITELRQTNTFQRQGNIRSRHTQQKPQSHVTDLQASRHSETMIYSLIIFCCQSKSDYPVLQILQAFHGKGRNWLDVNL